MDCNLGSEIGQKMRSAVKAKLLELGTGGSAGFIDDELPDYVMVMVANKRTKQQMNAELNLFLGDQTDLFVTWLHEVLQKLQEVTLPASASSKKRKSRQAELPKAKDKDKDKKSRDKKDKRTHRKSGDSDQFNSSADQPMPAISSITDVFAEELLEKAKKTLDVEDELVIKKKKRKITDDEEQQHPTTQETTTTECDVPNMSEISSTTVTSGNREKDIAELAEIQRKIYAAKLHLRQIGELDDESDEEEHDNQQIADDVLNVTDPVETFVKDTTLVSTAPVAPAETNSSSSTRKAKSPIVFNRTSEPTAAKDKPKPQPEPEVQLPKVSDERSERRSVHERLGSKPSQPSAAATASAPQQQQQPAATTAERSQRTQREMELYVPAHRRRNDQHQQEESKKVERGRERSQRNDIQPSRRRDRESLRGRRSHSRSRSPEANYKHRIGSRVIVAVNKAPEPSDDEDILEKPVNSVIKIKPRPTVSPRRQACKNLLLRAVADAQRSTILAKPTATTTANAVSSKSRGSGDEPEVISSTVGKRRVNRTLDNAAGKELFRRSRREMVINVLHRENKRMRPTIEPQTELKLVHKDLEDEMEEEYVPSLSAGEYEEYVPQIVENIDLGMDIDIDMHVEKSGSNLGVNPPVQSKTQFVVTLNGDHALSKASVAAAAAAASYRKRSRKRTPSPLVSSTSSTNVQLLNASVEPTSTTCASISTNSNSRDSRDRRSSNNRSKRARSSSRSSPSTSCNTPPQRPSRSLHRSEVLRQTQEIKKIIIKNDADDDEEEEHQHASPRKRSQKKRLSSSINVAASSSTSNEPKANSKPQPEESTRSTTPPLPPKRPEKRDQSNDRSTSTQAVASVITASVAATAVAAEAPAKVKHTPIRFKLKPEEEQQAQKSRRSVSKDRDSSMERRRISIRNAEDRKYDNLPALSAVSVDSAVLKVAKPKERCKYHPNCSKTFCEYYHPTAPCKSFPNCKFADKCMYSHPKCKFDLACISIDCNFAHSGARDLSHVQLAAPPLSSHVIPVQNYKSISAPSTATTGTTMCKYYPNCTKVGCTFYHPKPCRYGKNCINKLECIFYHPEMQSKFKWVASLG